MLNRRIVSPGHRHPGSEEGLTLVEVLVAVMVLMIVMLPSAWLIANTTMLLGSTKAKGSAEQIATSQVNQVSGNAKAQFPPKGSSTSPTTPSPALKNTAWEPSGAGSTVTIGTIKFLAYEAGGWCALEKGTSGYDWLGQKVTSAIGPPTYFVVIKVVWGVGHTTTTHTGRYSVIQSRSIVGSGGTPPANGKTATCPLGLV